MRILVIGASGQTGRHVVRLLLTQGHEVTAFVRSSSMLIEKNPHLRVVQGDARDQPSLARAVEGQDAVISCFGPKTLAKSDLQEVLMRNLVAAMTKHGVKRLVNLSAWGSGGGAVAPPPRLMELSWPRGISTSTMRPASRRQLRDVRRETLRSSGVSSRLKSRS